MRLIQWVEHVLADHTAGLTTADLRTHIHGAGGGAYSEGRITRTIEGHVRQSESPRILKSPSGRWVLTANSSDTASAEVERPTPVIEQVYEILRDAGRPLGLVEIMEALERRGYEGTAKSPLASVDAMIGKVLRTQKYPIQRVAPRLYTTADAKVATPQKAEPRSISGGVIDDSAELLRHVLEQLSIQPEPLGGRLGRVRVILNDAISALDDVIYESDDDQRSIIKSRFHERDRADAEIRAILPVTRILAGARAAVAPASVDESSLQFALGPAGALAITLAVARPPAAGFKVSIGLPLRHLLQPGTDIEGMVQEEVLGNLTRQGRPRLAVSPGAERFPTPLSR